MCALNSGDTLADEIGALLDDYEEFRLDQAAAPHTVGPSHLYIRRDIVESAEAEKIVPPYPVTFPHGYPVKNKSWYLHRMERHGSGKVKSREE